jgi:hypothetical protein
MTVTESLRAAAVAAAILALPASTVAAPLAHDDLPPAIEQVGPPPARADRGFQLSVDVRSALFRGAGYDPFSNNDVFVQTGVAGTWALHTSPTLSTAGGASFESGSAGASARGAETSLSLRRLAAVLEQRFAPRPWVYAFGRVSPGWLSGSASLSDASIAAPLRTSFSTFAVDASLGVAARLTGSRTRAGLWVVGDAGYGWAPDQRLALAPALPGPDASKAGVTTLADLAPRGVFFRFALAISF